MTIKEDIFPQTVTCWKNDVAALVSNSVTTVSVIEFLTYQIGDRAHYAQFLYEYSLSHHVSSYLPEIALQPLLY